MQVYYRKWRPQTLAELVGQDHVTQTLLNALKAGRVAHAYLFCGPRGTGKTSTGRILAKAANCVEGGKGEPCNACTICQTITEGRAMDVMEIDAASNRGIDEIRELRERVRYTPNIARYKVYIIDEVHMLTEPAANALLKTLEEPPPHVLFVLATTEPHKVPLTILSRCQRFDFRRIPQDAMVSRLAVICAGEGIQIDDSSLKLIARSATGSMRDAENLLEQSVAHYGSRIELHQVQAMLGISGDVRARELAGHIVDNDITAGLQTINSITQDGLDLRQFNRELVEYLRVLLLIKAGAGAALDLPPEELLEMRGLAERAPMAQLSKAAKLFRQVELELDGFSPLPLELAMVECALPQGESATPATIEKRAIIGEKPATPTKAEKTEGEPAGTPKPTGKKPATPAKAEKTEGEPAGTPEPAGEKPAMPVTGEKQEIIEEKPATPAKAEKTEGEPAGTPEPAGEKPAMPQKPQKSDIEYFRNRWKDVVSATKGMGSKGNLDALLRSACEPVALEGETLVLGFYYEFHKEKIEDPKYRHMVEAKVNEVFGKNYKIRCMLTERKAASRGHLVEAALQMGAKIVEEEE
jgi:DNA polymerase-3 subunit gamma/tau